MLYAVLGSSRPGIQLDPVQHRADDRSCCRHSRPVIVRPIRRCTDLSAITNSSSELLDCRQLAGTDLIVLAVRGGDPLSDGDEPFVHLGALIRRQ